MSFIRSGNMRASEEALKNRVEPKLPESNPDPAVIRPLPEKVEQYRGETPDAFWEAAAGLDHLDEMSEARAQIDLASVEERAEIAALESVKRTIDEIHATTPLSEADRDELVNALMPDALTRAKEMLE